ncbi:hypothetical protein K402DRAFT_200586 [Aulographum hederae CBS 113979]|uniref:L-lactate dehydrogenase (cytochrome) n=1 Tax=Aulographum hederae CBS 113979 TaxID=1176131 RepID=A0A6G1HBV0_9PEZI|nr:hypothetical protein K402DRAFT_200586 [Aulographum hederae CBS 113979]
MSKVLGFEEVSKHNTPDSCWVILYNNVYDVTSFLSSHPGGVKAILQLAGQDATQEYDPIHPPGTLETSLPASAKLGSIDQRTLPEVEKSPMDDGSAGSARPFDLEECLNLDDIEAAATKKISRKAWAYYYSAGDDLISKALNTSVYRKILLRPRVFVDCTNCDSSTSLLGHKINVPFFVSPAAMARLGHPDGEHGIAKACAQYGVAQLISNNASMTPEVITKDAKEDQVFGWQMYVQVERAKSEKYLERIHKLPNIKFIVLTLDAPVAGKREDDERMKNVGSQLAIRDVVTDSGGDADAGKKKKGKQGGTSVAEMLFAGTASDLTWKTTLPWLAKHTKLPIVLKGVQTHEDAYLASLYAPQIQAVILSNHGGRALDTAPPSIHTLLEIRKYCPDVFGRIDVWVDGGVRRGTDVVKALCLGAKAVGLGRPALFGLGAGGQEGVEKVFKILKEETKTCMRLLGVEKTSELGIKHVNTRAVEQDIYDGPGGLDELRPRLWQAKAKL